MNELVGRVERAFAGRQEEILRRFRERGSLARGGMPRGAVSCWWSRLTGRYWVCAVSRYRSRLSRVGFCATNDDG